MSEAEGMATIYNADEVFKMGEQIERNGRRFYLRAAGQCKDAAVKALLLRLADMEADHEAIFAKMRKDIARQGLPQIEYDPEAQASLYLQASADTHVFNVYQDQAALLKGKDSAEDILTIAIRFEKDTVVFFLGVKDVVPAHLGKDRIDWLIQQEMSHIVDLTSQLRSVREKATR